MATEFWYRASGAWRKGKEIYYRQGGVWRKAKEIWYRSGGTWRKVFSAIVETISPLGCQGVKYSSFEDSFASLTLTVRNNGTWDVTSDSGFFTGSPGSGNWAVGAPSAGLGDAMWVRFTRTASTGNGSSASTGWLQLSADRNVSCSSLAVSAHDSDSGIYTIEISPDGGSTVVSTTTGVQLSTGATFNPN